jgi:hypothetical protein
MRLGFMEVKHRRFSIPNPTFREQAAALHSALIVESTRSAFALKAEVRCGRRYFRKVPNPDVGASRGMAGSVAADRQLPQRVVGGCGAEFVGEVLVDGSHQALAGAGCSYSAALAH